MPIQLTKPIVPTATPASRNQAERVAKTSRNGRPAENPRNAMPTTRGRL